LTVDRHWHREDLAFKTRVDSGSATEVDFSVTTKEFWVWGNSGTTRVTISNTWNESVLLYAPFSETMKVEGLMVNNARSSKQFYYAGWY
jgi:hypothetical protein